jgi:hypothetical protein
MKRTPRFAAVITLAGALCVALPVVAQEGDVDHEAMMQEVMEKYTTPGEQHQYLEPFVGSWTTVASFWMMPGAEAETSKGTSVFAWAHGGRYLVETLEGTAMGQPFTGTGILGYDRFNEEWVSFWIDSMGTGFMMSTGTIDESGKVFTFEGTHDDIFAGEKDKWNKSVATIEDENSLVVSMYAKAPDGTEFKNLEVTYQRQDVAGN